MLRFTSYIAISPPTKCVVHLRVVCCGSDAADSLRGTGTHLFIVGTFNKFNVACNLG